jgi:hypothetical protein
VEIPSSVALVQRVPTYVTPVVEQKIPKIVVRPSTLGFPIVAIGDTTSLALTIDNTGNAVLDVTSITTPAQMYTVPVVNPGAPLSIPGGESSTVQVVLDPVDLTVAGSVVVTSNDPVDPTLNVGVTTDIRVSKPIPDSLGTFPENRPIDVLARLPENTGFLSGNLHYRRGGSEVFETVTVEQQGDSATAAIPDSIAANTGVQYWVEYLTQNGTFTDPPVAPENEPRYVEISFESISEEVEFPPETYRIMSLPNQPGKSYRGLFGPGLGAPGLFSYRAFRWDTTLSQQNPDAPRAGYVELRPDVDDEGFDLKPSRAFWHIQKTPSLVDFPGKSYNPLLGQISLAPGWNMIGMPFNFRVSWTNLMIGDQPAPAAQSAGDVSELFRWNHAKGESGEYEVASRLVPFEGYWICNLEDHTLTLVVPGVAENPLPVASPGDPRQPGDWTLYVGITAPGASDGFNELGVRDDAAAGFDRHDRLDPPPSPGRSLGLYFPRDKWGRLNGPYSADYRPGIGSSGGHIWRFDITKNYVDERPGDEVTISVHGVESVPRGLEVVLVDRELDRTVDMRAHASHLFFLRERAYSRDRDKTRFVLLVGNESFVKSNPHLLPSGPKQTALHQNVPNPFNPATIIRYELANPGRVSLKIYDVTGALVRVLEDGERGTGRYEVPWAGENERGEHVASGVYFYRLVAPGHTLTRKMVLLK